MWGDADGNIWGVVKYVKFRFFLVEKQSVVGSGVEEEV